jgi:glycosyltransferase involved in cell wall biosynthesis
MKIGLNASSLSYSRRTGIGRYTISLFEEFFRIAPDHEYYLYSSLPIDKKFKEKWKDYKNVHYREGNFPSRYVWLILFIWRWLKRDKIDCFLAIDGVLPLFTKVPCVAVAHDLLWLHFPKTTPPHIYWIYRLNLKRSIRRCRFCVSVSMATQKDIKDYTGITDDNACVIYEGVDRDIFRKLEDSKIQSTLMKYEINDQYLFFIGNLMDHKNLVGLLHAFRIFIDELKKEGRSSPLLVIAGCSKWRSSSIYKTARELDLGKRIRFLGYVTDVELVDFYSGAELFVFPTFIEGFGLPILEAQACGVPVLCSNCTSLPEVAGEGAVLCDPYSAEDIAAGMMKIFMNPDLRENLIKQGYENIKRFSWEKSARQILGILKNSI